MHFSASCCYPTWVRADRKARLELEPSKCWLIVREHSTDVVEDFRVQEIGQTKSFWRSMRIGTDCKFELGLERASRNPQNFCFCAVFHLPESLKLCFVLRNWSLHWIKMIDSIFCWQESPQVTSSNTLFVPQFKDIQFTVKEKPKKPENIPIWHKTTLTSLEAVYQTSCSSWLEL